MSGNAADCRTALRPYGLASVRHTIRPCAALLLLLFLSTSHARCDAMPETRALLTAPVQACALAGNTVYAIVSNCLWRCSFGLSQWEQVGPLPFQPPAESLRSFRAAPRRRQTLYLLSSANLYISRDAGASWVSRRLTAETREYFDVCPFPDESGRLVVATDDGAWISRDDGQNYVRFFSRVNVNENCVSNILINANGERAYVATSAGTFISTDAGRTFRLVLGLPRENITLFAAPAIETEFLVFVAGGRLFLSDAHLETFRLLSSIYDFSECQQIIIAENGRDIVWSYPGGVRWGKDWLPASMSMAGPAPLAPQEAEPAVIPPPQPAIGPPAATVSQAFAQAETKEAEILQRATSEQKYRRSLGCGAVQETLDICVAYSPEVLAKQDSPF